jgi:lipopolysaccharide transport system ATP-binding protein
MEWDEPNSAPGNSEIRVRAVRVVPDNVDPSRGISMGTPLRIEIEYWNLVPETAVDIDVELFTMEGQAVLETHTSDEPGWQPSPFARGLFRSVCRIPGDLLNQGEYRLRVLFLDTSPAKLFDYPWAAVFAVQDLTVRRVAWYGRFKGVIHPLLHWNTERLSDGDALQGPAGNRDPGEAVSGQGR